MQVSSQSVPPLDKFKVYVGTVDAITTRVIVYILAYYSCAVSFLTIFAPVFDWPKGLIPFALGALFFFVHIAIRNQNMQKDILFSRLFNSNFDATKGYWSRPATNLLYLPISLALGNHVTLFFFPELGRGYLSEFMSEASTTFGPLVFQIVIMAVGLYLAYTFTAFLLRTDFVGNIISGEPTKTTVSIFIGVITYLLLLEVMGRVLRSHQNYASATGLFLIGSISLFLARMLFIGIDVSKAAKLKDLNLESLLKEKKLKKTNYE